jgi:hypothetical protein
LPGLEVGWLLRTSSGNACLAVAIGGGLSPCTLGVRQ